MDALRKQCSVEAVTFDRTKYTNEKLYQCLEAMPKGSMVHLHSLSGVDMMWLFKHLAANHRGIYVYLPQGALDAVALDDDPDVGQLNWYTPDQVPAQWVALADLAKRRGLHSLVRKYYHVDCQQVEESRRWPVFQAIWNRIRFISHSVDVWCGAVGQEHRSVLWHMLEEGLQENVTYMEVKKVVSFPYFTAADDNPETESVSASLSGRRKQVTMEYVFERIGEVERKLRAANPRFLGCPVVLTSLKFETAADISRHLSRSIELKKKFPLLVSGFDLAGEEDALRPISDYLDVLKGAKEEMARQQVDLQLLLHAGETLQPDNLQIRDAVALGCPRIGHGFALSMHPQLIQQVVDEGIMLECCPLSNHALGYCSDIGQHPSLSLMKKGVKLCINSDDPSFFGYDKVTLDWFYIVLSWKLSVDQLRDLAVNSLSAVRATLGNVKYEQALSQFIEDWQMWEQEWGLRL